MCPDAGREPARPAPGQLLDERGIRDEVAVAPVLGRELESDIPELREAPEDLVREPARLLPFAGAGRELALREAADRGAELLVLLGERWDRPARRGRRRPGLL
jgi:hypothetical protein